MLNFYTRSSTFLSCSKKLCFLETKKKVPFFFFWNKNNVFYSKKQSLFQKTKFFGTERNKLCFLERNKQSFLERNRNQKKGTFFWNNNILFYSKKPCFLEPNKLCFLEGDLDTFFPLAIEVLRRNDCFAFCFAIFIDSYSR